MLWNVPITIATRSNPEACKFILKEASDVITIEGAGPDDWILVINYKCGFGMELPEFKGHHLHRDDISE